MAKIVENADRSLFRFDLGEGFPLAAELTLGHWTYGVACPVVVSLAEAAKAEEAVWAEKDVGTEREEWDC